MLAKIAPKKDEYLASGPNVATATDSICPEVNDTNACDAISGTNIPLKDSLNINDIASAAIPAASPQIKNIIYDQFNNFRTIVISLRMKDLSFLKKNETYYC